MLTALVVGVIAVAKLASPVTIRVCSPQTSARLTPAEHSVATLREAFETVAELRRGEAEHVGVTVELCPGVHHHTSTLIIDASHTSAYGDTIVRGLGASNSNVILEAGNGCNRVALHTPLLRCARR